MSGVTAWIASATSRATMQNDLKLLPLTMWAPPSVTSPTARILHDLEITVTINYSLILVKRQSLRAVPLFFPRHLFPSTLFAEEGPSFFLHVEKTLPCGCLPREGNLC